MFVLCFVMHCFVSFLDLQLCFSLQSRAGGWDFRLLEGSDLSIDKRVRA